MTVERVVWEEEDEMMLCVCRHCNTLQHTATHCNTLQHTATHCNTLQHTATHIWRMSYCHAENFIHMCHVTQCVDAQHCNWMETNSYMTHVNGFDKIHVSVSCIWHTCITNMAIHMNGDVHVVWVVVCDMKSNEYEWNMSICVVWVVVNGEAPVSYECWCSTISRSHMSTMTHPCLTHDSPI